MAKGSAGSREALERLRNSLREQAQSGGDVADRRAERALLARARAGEKRALEQLLLRASKPAYRFSVGFCRDPHDAEDLVQDVLITLMRSLASFRGDAALSTWVYTVARRACMRRRQRGARQRPFEPRHLDRPDPAPGPSVRSEQSELARALEQAIASLPHAQREVIVMRDVEGLSAAEAAAVLGIGERALKSRLHRARTELRAKLAPLVQGADAPAPSHACPDVARTISRFLEGELDAAACARMEAHVRGCPACEGACRSLREVLKSCRAYGRRPVPAHLREAVRFAVRELVR